MFLRQILRPFVNRKDTNYKAINCHVSYFPIFSSIPSQHFKTFVECLIHK